MLRFHDQREDPWGQDRRPPGPDELLYLREMTPGADEMFGVQLQPRETAEEEAGEA